MVGVGGTSCLHKEGANLKSGLHETWKLVHITFTTRRSDSISRYVSILQT